MSPLKDHNVVNPKTRRQLAALQCQENVENKRRRVQSPPKPNKHQKVLIKGQNKENEVRAIKEKTLPTKTLTINNKKKQTEVSKKQTTKKVLQTVNASTINKEQSTGTVVTRRVTRSSVKKCDSSDESIYGTPKSIWSNVEKPFKRINDLKELIKKEGLRDVDSIKTDLWSMSQYAMIIFEYSKLKEKQFVVNNYMQRQTKLNVKMRAIVVDWLVSVQDKLELNHETLYLSVKMMDLYLSKKVLSSTSKFQLLALACIFIASKYDEQLLPSTESFLALTDNSYSDLDLYAMERDVLILLDFNIGIPLSYKFLRRYARCNFVDLPFLCLSRYILELSLLDYAFVQINESKLAAASLSLAFQMSKKEKWNKISEYNTGYKYADLKSVIEMLNNLLKKLENSNLKAIRSKYSLDVFFKVTKIPLLKKIED